ncbi:hypothetical protein [Tessaracoccus lacteus]|uniref:ANTAR domain-containing protein n=1 Tax=Tessaracoccus lacteus TaxID=3041766 RepID=A0ABY8PYH1_9ACTN|nr:hypothetical protein [Tessaracoccus sp. T21]WGT47227.1 hypothetical protein QH948_00065 [Tessaracoccus sp. T21]
MLEQRAALSFGLLSEEQFSEMLRQARDDDDLSREHCLKLAEQLLGR